MIDPHCPPPSPLPLPHYDGSAISSDRRRLLLCAELLPLLWLQTQPSVKHKPDRKLNTRRDLQQSSRLKWKARAPICSFYADKEPSPTPARPHLLHLMKETIEMPARYSIKWLPGFIFPGGLLLETPKYPPKIAIRTFTESRIPQDESHKSSRSRANEFWICRRDQEGFRHELWIWQKFRVL